MVRIFIEYGLPVVHSGYFKICQIDSIVYMTESIEITKPDLEID